MGASGPDFGKKSTYPVNTEEIYFRKYPETNEIYRCLLGLGFAEYYVRLLGSSC